MGRVFDAETQKRLENTESLDKVLSTINSLFPQETRVDKQSLAEFNLTRSSIVSEVKFEETVAEKFENVNKYVSNQLKMFYMVEQAYKLIPNPEEYDLIIRLRPDLNFVEVRESDLYDAATESFSCYVLMNQVDGIDDKFALMDPKAAQVYSSIYSRFESQGLNYLDLDYAKFAESLVLRHLYAEGVTPKLLKQYRFGGLSNGKISRDEVISRLRSAESEIVDNNDSGEINKALGLLL
jgi:hypothetical protein